MYNQYDEKGLKTGLWIERDERGCLISEKEYKAGKLNGACIIFEKETGVPENIIFYGEDVRLEEIDFEKGKTIGITWYEENSPAYNFGFTGNRTVSKNDLIETKLYEILKNRMTKEVIEFLKKTDLKDIFE